MIRLSPLQTQNQTYCLIRNLFFPPTLPTLLFVTVFGRVLKSTRIPAGRQALYWFEVPNLCGCRVGGVPVNSIFNLISIRLEYSWYTCFTVF